MVNYQQEIDNRILQFQGIDLEGLNAIRLMNRQDTKYIFHISFLPDVLEKLNRDYFVLDIDSHRLMTYDSLYYDTDDLHFYIQHHCRLSTRMV